MRARNTSNGRGFVFVVAVLMIALIGAAMAAISGVVAADAGRTRDRSRDAQLEQMLLAAAADAPAHLTAQTLVEGQSWILPLPASLSSLDADLQVHVGPVQPNGPATLVIRATFDGGHAEQTAQFSLVNNTWTLVAAELGHP